MSGLFGLKSCKVYLNKPSNFFYPFVCMNYFSLVFVSFPTIGLLFYIFFLFSQGSYVYLLAVDCTIAISISILFTIFDIVHINTKLIQTPFFAHPNFTETSEIDNKADDTKSVNPIDTNRANESIILSLADEDLFIFQKISSNELDLATASIDSYNKDLIIVKHKSSGLFLLIKTAP